jgi:hypothetical protein
MASLGKLVKSAVESASGQILGSGTRDGEVAYRSTRVIASFHSDEGFDGAVDSTFDAKPDDQPFHIVSLSTHKSFGGSPGTWALTVKTRANVDLLRLWQDPEDVWVRIVVVKNGVPNEVMLGLVSTITEDLTRGDQGQRSLTYTIQGLDFHKVLTQTQLYINIHENAGALPIIPLYNAMAENLIGAPNETLENIMWGWLGNNGVADKQWRMPGSLGGGYFFDLLTLDFQECRGKIYDPALYNPDQWMGRSLWDTLEEYSNGLLNELYTQSGFEDVPYEVAQLPDPHLTLRERPFPTTDKGRSDWEDVRTHELKAGDVHGRNISRGAPESRFNYWLLEADGLIGDGLGVQLEIQQAAEVGRGQPGSAPIYNLDDIRKHGFRRFSQRSRYFPFREEIEWLHHSAKWLKMLHDWYVVVPYELAGSLDTTSIFPRIRIGQRVTEKRKDGVDVTYYVEGVSHTWQYPGPGQTTLNVTRGEYGDEDLLEVAYGRISEPKGSPLDNAIEEAVGLVTNTALGAAVPTGSGPRLDRAVGQVDTAERLYLRNRGKIDDQQHIKRGELRSPPGDRRRRLRPADLPDQQVPVRDEILVGNAEERERKQGGNLTQRELESGIRLPVREEGITQTESSRLTVDEQRARRRRIRSSRKGRT